MEHLRSGFVSCGGSRVYGLLSVVSAALGTEALMLLNPE